MSLAIKARSILLVSAAAAGCSHTHPAATPADASTLQVLVNAKPNAELGELVPDSVPLARVYNVTQAAREALVARMLEGRVSPADLHAGLRDGARSGLAGLHIVPGTAVQVSLDRWGISTPLPSDPGALQITVQARLRGPRDTAVFARPVTCSVDLAHLAGTAPGTGPRHADKMLGGIPQAALSEAVRSLASDCGSQALRALPTG